MQPMKIGDVRKVGIWTRFLGASLSALLVAVAVLHGREICFCHKEFDPACHTEHCRSCEPCPAVAAAGDVALLTGSCACDHFHVEGVDLRTAADDSGTCVCAGEVVRTEPFAVIRVLSTVDGFLPPTTAPPDTGGDYVIYRARALLRS